MLTCCQLDPRNKLQWNSNQNTKLFVQENAFKMLSAKWRPFHSGLIVLLLYATREYALSIVLHVAPARGITAPQKVTGINVWAQLQEFLDSPAPIYINTLRYEQNGQMTFSITFSLEKVYFHSDFDGVSFRGQCTIVIQISLQFLSKDQIHKKSALIQVIMAWCRTGDKLLPISKQEVSAAPIDCWVTFDPAESPILSGQNMLCTYASEYNP